MRVLRKRDGHPLTGSHGMVAMRVHEYCTEIRAFACLVDFGHWKLTLDTGIESHETTSSPLTTLIIFWIVPK
jgi:hypothetical protein